MMRELEGKIVVIYGAEGAVGSTAAHEFSREGARVFLTGRSTSKLNNVAKEIALLRYSFFHKKGGSQS